MKIHSLATLVDRSIGAEFATCCFGLRSREQYIFISRSSL